MSPHVGSAFALVLFSVALFHKIRRVRRRGLRVNHLANGKKSFHTSAAEWFVIFTNYPLLILWSLLVVRVVSFSPMILFDPLRWSGVVVTWIGVVVYAVAVFTLGDSWRVGIDPASKEAFVYHGIYRISRHPAYLGFSILYLGLSLTFFHPVLLVLSILSVLALIRLARQEERQMILSHGESYRLYQKRVGFWIGIHRP
jgi:protein-S-isoprenylcysteine O-methyltransferase Ste14